jgi:protease-4
MHQSAAEDRGPLAEMPVIADQCAVETKIALIDVDGLLVNTPLAGMGSLGENPVSIFREKLDRIAADPCCRAVVVRINSPGGGVTASDIMWRDLRTFKQQTGLPVVACLMDLGTGGAYYLASAADHIVAHPTTVTGGMGVILNLYNLQDAMMQFNIMGAPIKAGKYVDLGTPIVPPDEEARQILQHAADQCHRRFQEVVRITRPEHDPNRLEDFDGRILLAQEALDHRLIDSIGYLDDAVATARRMGGALSAPVVMYHRSNDAARTPYAVTPNIPLQTGMLPLSLPGLERTQLPTFLYIWQPEPTLERRATGR